MIALSTMGDNKRHDARAATPKRSKDPVDYSDRGTQPAVQTATSESGFAYENASGEAVVIDYDAAKRRPTTPPDYNLADHYDPPTRVDVASHEVYAGPDTFAPQVPTSEVDRTGNRSWDDVTSAAGLLAKSVEPETLPPGDDSPQTQGEADQTGPAPIDEVADASETAPMQAPHHFDAIPRERPPASKNQKLIRGKAASETTTQPNVLSEDDIKTDQMEKRRVITKVVRLDRRPGPPPPARQKSRLHQPKPPRGSSSEALNKYEVDAIGRGPVTYLVIGLIAGVLISTLAVIIVLALGAGILAEDRPSADSRLEPNPSTIPTETPETNDTQ